MIQQRAVSQHKHAVRPGPVSGPVPALGTLAAAADQRLDEQVAIGKRGWIDLAAIHRELTGHAPYSGGRASLGKCLLVAERRLILALQQRVDSALGLAPLEEGRRAPGPIAMERKDIIPGADHPC